MQELQWFGIESYIHFSRYFMDFYWEITKTLQELLTYTLISHTRKGIPPNCL